MGEHLEIRTPDLVFDVLVSGATTGDPVMLLHGWPDGPGGWAPIADKLAVAGFRVAVPALRGSGATRFLRPAMPRTGHLSALTEDVLALADAMGWPKFHLAGHDWGARTAYRTALVAPERLSRIATLAAPWSPAAAASAVSVSQAQMYWYQWLFNTPMGPRLLAADRDAFVRHIWREWSPTWQVPETELAAALRAMDNPDWARITVDYYRNRWDWGESDLAAVTEATRIEVPALVVHGTADGCVAPAAFTDMRQYFPAGYESLELPRIGHFPHREAPDAVTEALLRWFSAPESL